MISAGCARTVTGARSMKNGEVGTDMHEKIARLLEREGTGISWCDLTLNPWIGCTKVSPACDHCYPEELATNRLGVKWGPGAPRRRTTPGNRSNPKIGRASGREGECPYGETSVVAVKLKNKTNEIVICNIIQ